MRYFEQERQKWIEEIIQIYGFIQRQHLVKKFGISIPQASADLQRFQKAFPKSIKYNKSQKKYVLIREIQCIT